MTDPTIPIPQTTPPTWTPPTSSPRGSMRWITPTLAIIAALAVGIIGGVFIGRSDQAQAGQNGYARGQNSGTSQLQRRAPGAQAGRGLTAGKIVAIDGTTITVKAKDGTEKKITTTPNTKVSKTIKSTIGALKMGETITVIGATGSDGTVAARAISQGASLRHGMGQRPGGAETPPPAN